MTRLLRAEIAKLLTLRATYVALAVTAIGAGGLTALLTHTLASEHADLAARREVLTIAGATHAPAMALLLGMFVVGTEFRHNTITPALLITPVRSRIFYAKSVVAAAAGVVLAGVATLTGLVSATAVLAAVGSPALLDGGDIAAIIASSIGLSVLYGVAGVGIATLIRNPTSALIVGLSALYVISPLMSVLVPAWVLPGGASEVVGLGAVTPQATSLWVAAAVLTAYVGTLAAASWHFALPRDVT